jgi:hypothetical protein
VREDVTTEVVVRAGSGRNRKTTLRLSWSRHDPLAVALRLYPSPDHPALPRGHWSVLRDFLRYGLAEPTGDGDVRIVPDGGRHKVRLELLYDGRRTAVSLPSRTMRDFLDATERIVPSGEETSEIILDALIVRLLQQTD